MGGNNTGFRHYRDNFPQDTQLSCGNLPHRSWLNSNFIWPVTDSKTEKHGHLPSIWILADFRVFRGKSCNLKLDYLLCFYLQLCYAELCSTLVLQDSATMTG